MDSRIRGRSNTAVPQGLRAVLTLLGAVAAVQLLWWLLVNPLFHSSPMPAGTELSQALVAPLEAPELALLGDAQWQPVTLTWSECCTASYYAVRMTLPQVAPPGRDVGLITNVGADNYWVYVNGIAIRAFGQLQPSSYHGLRKEILLVPAAVLRETNNEVLILTARNGLYYTDVFRAFAGDYRQLLAGTRWRQFVVNELRLINTVIPIMIGCIAIMLLLQARSRAFLLALAALALVWGLRNGLYIWETFPFGDVARRSYYAWITNGLPVAWFAFVHFWAGSLKPSSAWTYALGAVALAWVIACAAATWFVSDGGVHGIETSERIIEVFGVSVTVVAAIRMLSHLFTVPETRPLEAALLLLCMTTFAIEMAQYFFGQFGSTSSAHSASLFLLAFVVAIVARNVQLFESMESFNRSLNRRLAVSEAEIRESYQSLAAANRRETLSTERQRLLQDMHDGIGGQLVALLAVVRGRPNDLSVVEQALAETLEDLRLIIDSLDSATNDLAVALGIFRSRVEPRLASAGLQSTWKLDAIPMALQCSPGQVLHLYRILQEAVSNCLKHAGASTLEFSAQIETRSNGQRRVHVTVADDGQWQEQTPRVPGHGLESMRRRAQALGGELEILRQQTGTKIAIAFDPLIDVAASSSAPLPTHIGGVKDVQASMMPIHPQP